jgi:hypothetical protein
VARHLGGGGRGEQASHGEEAARWRQARQTRPGRKCGVEESVWGDSGEEAVGNGA